MISGISDASREFPAAIKALRTMRSRPVRYRSPSETLSKRSVIKREQLPNRGVAILLSRKAHFARGGGELFHGQAARQSSQPKTGCPWDAQRGRDVSFVFDGRYAMQRRASRR